MRILSKLLVLVKDKEIAKEILQDVFLTIWEKRQAVDAEKSFRSYLFRIVENKVVDFFRCAAYDKELQEHLIRIFTEFHCQTEEASGFNEKHSLLQQAINSLSPQRKKYFSSAVYTERVTKK